MATPKSRTYKPIPLSSASTYTSKLTSLLTNPPETLSHKLHLLHQICHNQLQKPFKITHLLPNNHQKWQKTIKLIQKSRFDEPLTSCLPVTAEEAGDISVRRAMNTFKDGFVLIGEVYEESNDEWEVIACCCFSDVELMRSMDDGGVYQVKWGEPLGLLYGPMFMDAYQKLAVCAPGEVWTCHNGCVDKQRRRNYALLAVMYAGTVLSEILGSKWIVMAGTDHSVSSYDKFPGVKTLHKADPRELVVDGKQPFAKGACKLVSVLQYDCKEATDSIDVLSKMVRRREQSKL